ncbi:MAG: hypothetical protein F6K50_48885 [Moorea sp. SIO3I7]|nr:hypothetical protein [Moorena sp. SIO3I7]
MVSGQPLAFACSRSVGVAHKLKVSIQLSAISYQPMAKAKGHATRMATLLEEQTVLNKRGKDLFNLCLDAVAHGGNPQDRAASLLR